MCSHHVDAQGRRYGELAAVGSRIVPSLRHARLGER